MKKIKYKTFILSLKKLFSTNVDEPELICGEYHVSNAEQLIWFAKRVNSGDIKINGKLLEDIDISDENDFKGIGTNQNPYQGIFNGNGYSIKVNLNVIGNNSALFRVVDSNAIIKNLNIIGVI